MRKYNKKELPLRRGNSFLLDCTTKSEMDSVSISGRFFSLFPVVVQSTIGTLNDGALPLIERKAGYSLTKAVFQGKILYSNK